LPDGFDVALNDSGLSVMDTTKVTAKLNGVTVTPVATKPGGATTVTYHGYPALLTPGAGPARWRSPPRRTRWQRWRWLPDVRRRRRTGSFAAQDAVAAGSVDDASKVGFRLKPWQYRHAAECHLLRRGTARRPARPEHG
jgi:hypothetical protein